MTLRRVVALAQALTMILLLLPGPLSTGPAPVHAALRPAEADPTVILDAAGRGIGCQTSGGKYKGPGLPKDPPWPPGAEPTPTPEPSPVPGASADPAASAEPTADVGTEPELDAAAEPSAEPEAATMAFVAATDVRFVQAEIEAEPVVPAAPAAIGPELITGIDVSHWQKDLDFEAVREAGHRFVLMKATENNDHLDTYFATYVGQARAAGLTLGSYHVLDYTLDGKVQADHYVERVEAVLGFDGSLPPIVDVECFDYYGASNHSASAARLRDFIEQVYRRTGRMPIVYTSQYMWREVVGNAEGFEDLPLWTACWGCAGPPALPEGWEEWAFWQYTNGGTRIPGRVAKVDGNYFSGTKKQLKALKLRPFAIAGGAAATSGGPVELDLGGRDATHIRTSPDGKSWSEWERMGSTPTARIPTEEGRHTVYAQLRNGPGLKSPVVSDTIMVDQTPPEVSPPTVSLRAAALAEGGSDIPISVGWQARDELAGMVNATIAVSCGESPTQRTKAPGSADPGELVTWAGTAMLLPGATCAVTVIGRDGAGNISRASTEGVSAAIVATDVSSPVAEVSADQVGVIARPGPDAGRATVLLDDEALALIDLYAPISGGPELVYVTDLPPGDHTITVEASGSSDPASSGTGVIVDGFATLSR